MLVQWFNIVVKCLIGDVKFKAHHEFCALMLQNIDDPCVLVWLLVSDRKCEETFTFTTCKLLDVEGFIIRLLRLLCLWRLFVCSI
jgi:hypothetical protein